jgi:hypothetical protein
VVSYRSFTETGQFHSWGRILDEVQTKVLRVFLLAIQSHLYSFALRFLFLQTHATSFSFFSALLYTVKEKAGKLDRKPHPLFYGLRNPYRNLKSKNSQYYAQKPQRNCTFMNSASTLCQVGILAGSAESQELGSRLLAEEVCVTLQEPLPSSLTLKVGNRWYAQGADPPPFLYA